MIFPVFESEVESLGMLSPPEVFSEEEGLEEEGVLLLPPTFVEVF